MKKILSFCAATLFAAGMVAATVVLPATLDVSNVSYRSEEMPDFVIEAGQDYAGTYFDMGAHDSSNDTLLYAEWEVTIEPIKYNVAVDVYNTNSWRVQLDLLNQSNDVVKAIRYKGSSEQKGQFAIGAMDLSDLDAGNYKVRVRAATAWSAMKLKDVIFTADYQGVSVTLPGTLQPAYALLSSGASVANNAIAFTPGTAPNEYATWNVSFAEAGAYNVTIDFTASNGHTYGVALLSADGTSEIGSVGEAQAWDTGIKELGSITIPAAGNYVVKLTNATQWSEAVLNSIIFAAPQPALEPATFYGATSFLTEGTVINPVQWAGIEYNITRNADKTLTFEAEFTNAVTGLVAQINLGAGFQDMVADGLKFTYTTTDTYEDGTALEGAFFYFPYAGAAKRVDIAYTVGAENEKPETPVDPRPAVPDTQLNIFASGLQVSAVEDDKATVSYVLNAVATAVEVQLLDVDGVVIKTYPAPYSAYNKGANSFEIDLSDVADGTYHWAVKATSNATTTLANVITNYTDGIYNYYLPQGLAIDNNPENPYFGRIYVSESRDGANDGATARTKAMTRGVFIYDALLNDVTSQGTTGYLGGLTDMTASDRTAFKRIVVDKDGYVYINSMDATRGGVYRMDPANPSADFVPVLDLAQKGTTYTTISSMAVEGQGAEKVLYTADNFVASATTGSINKYAIGNATNYAQQPDTFVTVSGDNDLGISDNQFVSDGRGGFWGCQHRWGYDTWAAVYHLTAAGVRDYVIQSGTNTDVLPQSSDVTTYRGVIAINESKTLLAIPTKSRVVVYNIAYDEETGVPTLTEAYRTENIFGNNIDGLAFDYAENLYVLSASKEMFYAYATVKPNNSCVTPAPTTSTITLGTPIDDTYFAYTVTETIAKNTETAATGGTIIFGADKFEIMSGTELFGYKLDGNPSETNSKYVLCKLNRPLAAGDVISITGFASSNPKDGQAFQVSLDRAGSQVVGSAATTVAKAIETLDIHINAIGVGATEFYITRVSQSVYFTAVKVHADEGPATGFDNLNEAPKAEKFFMNGQVYIRRDGAVYTITGVRVK
ncbi:MAG: hypothetical protein IJS13_05055 [Paludibacteraceae bacterium]|nr:hypothetical protein [Paludibacteraceae bacterium]